MLGKPEWFERRKYSGWGLTPKTWQGWAYIALMALPVLVMPVIPASAQWATYLIYAWLLIAALVVGLAAKACTNYRLEKTN